MLCIKTRLYLELELPPDKAPSLSTITYDEILCIVFQFLEVLLGQWSRSNRTQKRIILIFFLKNDFYNNNVRKIISKFLGCHQGWVFVQEFSALVTFFICFAFQASPSSCFVRRRKKLFVQKSWLASIRINVNDTREVDWLTDSCCCCCCCCFRQWCYRAWLCF